MSVINAVPLLAAAGGDYQISRSVRLRSSASAYFNRTSTSSVTSNTTWTYSFWMKIGSQSTSGAILEASSSGTTGIPRGGIRWGGSNDLELFQYNGSTYDYRQITTQVFRDPSAWYHIVVVADTSNGTAANRMKLYVNNVQVTSWSTNTQPSSSLATYVGSASKLQRIGVDTYNGSSEVFDGYLTEVNFIDGQALTPSSFGENDTVTGVWKPKRYTGTYGTNGFYLNFSDNSGPTSGENLGIGRDFSGNGNYWNSNNINAYSGNGQKFTTVGTTTWTAPAGVTSVGYLIVAGGGGGGGTSATSGNGGGGAGGLLQGVAAVVPGTTYTITVGAGGIANTSNGGDSSISGSGFTTLTAIGGGRANVSGGSGGGAIYASSPGSGTAGQGNAGGSGSLNGGGNTTGGGGGGAGGVGGNASSGGAGAGGIGALSSITGTATYYAGGGAGGAEGNSNASGGAGGGGNSGASGAANTGGGGGGGGVSSGNAGNGGSGIVILSYNGGTLLSSSPTTDSMIDTPTPYIDGGTNRGNYCTLSPLQIGPYAALSAGNLRVTGNSGTNSAVSLGTFSPTSGKWYWEVTQGTLSSEFIGVMTKTVTGESLIDGSALAQTLGKGVVARYNGAVRGISGELQLTTTSTWTSGDIIQLAVDLDNGAVYFGKNGTWLNSGVPTSGSSKTGSFLNFTQDGTRCCTPACDAFNGGYVDANFGQRPFSYTPPSGFKALNTQNLPTPTIANGASYMAATTYTGNNSTNTIANTVNGVSMKPDLVWIKGRSQSSNNVLQDSVRGANRYLISNSTGTEGTDGSLTAFNSNGFSLTTDAGVSFNANGTTYVGWQWQAGQGTTSSNTSGSITSTVSVNATAGFSVVTYTGTGANATVGHGLGVAPKMVIVKCRNAAATSWAVYHANQNATPQNGALLLESTAAYAVSSAYWNNTAPTSSLFTVGTGSAVNTNTNTYVAYCWAAVAGYSAFGSYTGNGSADGPFVFLGFRPRFILIKRTDTSGTNWHMLDSARDTYNASGLQLYSNLSSAEDDYRSSNPTDFLSNGFKPRNTLSGANASGGTYIYAAFAENPFKNALAR